MLEPLDRRAVRVFAMGRPRPVVAGGQGGLTRASLVDGSGALRFQLAPIDQIKPQALARVLGDAAHCTDFVLSCMLERLLGL